MCTITAINFLFLERYYITKKTEVLEAAVNDLQKLKIVTDAEGNSTAEISDSLKRECSENNLTWTIITVDGKEVASEGGNEKMLQARLIGYAYDLDEQKGWTKILGFNRYLCDPAGQRQVCGNGLCRKLGRAG